MTVSTTINKTAPLAANGSVVVFNFSFPITAETDLRVIHTDAAGVETVLALTTEYTVSTGPWPSGGSITTVATYASGVTITVKRVMSLTQLIDYISGGSFNEDLHEGALDKLTFICQQLAEAITRAVLLKETSTLSDITLPSPVANGLIGWDSLATDLTTYTELTPGALVVSAFIETLLDDSDAGAALTTLGFSAFVKTLVSIADAAAMRTALSIKPVSVKDFGAVGDGVTDDLTEIQAAIDFVEAAGGGQVFFPAGDYLISAKLTADSDVALVGEGQDVSRILGDNLTTALISSSVVATRFFRWTFRDIGFDNQDRANAGGIGIDATNISMATFDNVQISNVEKGLLLVKNGASGGAFYNDFYSLRIITVDTGIDIGDTANENRFYGGRINDCITGVVIDDNTSNTFWGTAVEVFTTAFSISPSNTTQYTKLNDVRLENTPTSGTGILIGATAQSTYIKQPMFVGLTADITDGGVDTNIDSDNIFQHGTGSTNPRSLRILDTITAVINFPSIAAHSTNDQAVVVTGAANTDHWMVTPSASLGTGLMANAIPGSGQVFIRLANVTAGAIDPPALTYSLTRLKYNP